MGDFIVIAVLVIIIGLILRSAWKNRKNGGHCAGCSKCSGSASAGSCCSSSCGGECNRNK